MDSKSSKDIAVFTFARGSQLHTNIIDSESYTFVLDIINSMMKRHGVDTFKVGLGGTKEDVCCFIAGLIEYQLIFNINVELLDGDTSDYDIDTRSDVYDDELG